MRKIVIVGGVAGGATAAARLRRLDGEAEILLFERGAYVSFANCGLPYYIGGVIEDRAELLLQTPESFKTRFGVDVRAMSEVTNIDRSKREVTVRTLADGAFYTECYDSLILSPGAAPVRSNIPGADLPHVFTIRSLGDTDDVKRFIERVSPKKAIVMGGGYIGIEMAENLNHAGLSVTVIEKDEQIIAALDYEMAVLAHRALRENGIDLLLDCATEEITEHGEGLRVLLSGGEALQADFIIMAIGVRPETELARKAGLRVGACGGIEVDCHMRTSDKNIYAVGDATEVSDFVTGQSSLIPLAGPANKQGRIAADNICGIRSEYKGTQGSSVLGVFGTVFSMTGINEKKAKRLGINYDKIYLFPNDRAGYYPGAKPLAMKVLFSRDDGRIFGAQIVGGFGADKRCDMLASAIRSRMTYRDLTELELCYAPPYSSAKDPVNMAGYVIENIMTGKVKSYHWHDVDALPRDGSVTLLDVRNPDEVEDKRIYGFANIPLDVLRDHLDEFDPRKPIYLMCKTGLRSYIASRLLSQRGFDTYNLSGGYEVYDLARKSASAFA